MKFKKRYDIFFLNYINKNYQNYFVSKQKMTSNNTIILSALVAFRYIDAAKLHIQVKNRCTGYVLLTIGGRKSYC